MKYDDLYDGGLRYQARDNVKNAADSKDNTGVGEKTALSTSVPKPNVVRIEVLPASVRREYLGSFYSVFDRVRTAVANANASEDTYLPFYGIMTEGGEKSIHVKADWGKVTEGGFSGAVQLLKGIVSPVTQAKWVQDLAKNTLPGQAVTQAAKIGEAARVSTLNLAEQAGIMASGVGTSTLKSFKAGEIELNHTVTVQWYMPEQEIQCMVGIERLFKMAYLRATNKGMAENIRQLMSDVSKAGKAELDNSGHDTLGSIVGGLSNAAESDTTKKAVGSIDKYTGDFWGTHYTTAPLPVRLTIGHALDIQPMVITNVDISMSDEQFISTICGAHLPMMVTAKIQLSPWLIPSPGQQYMAFLGHEMFGKYSTTGKKRG